MNALITLLAQAMDVPAEQLLKALSEVPQTVEAEAPAKATTKVPFTKANGEVVMATPKQVAAWTRFRDGAASAATGLNQAVSTPATPATPATGEVVIGFRHSGTLARRSAYVVADALGLENTPATRKALLDTPKEALLAQLAAAGVTAQVVPAASL